MVVFAGALVGYLRTAEPADFADLDAEAPIISENRGMGRGRGWVVEMLRYWVVGSITSDGHTVYARRQFGALGPIDGKDCHWWRKATLSTSRTETLQVSW